MHCGDAVSSFNNLLSKTFKIFNNKIYHTIENQKLVRRIVFKILAREADDGGIKMWKSLT